MHSHLDNLIRLIFLNLFFTTTATAAFSKFLKKVVVLVVVEVEVEKT